MAATEADLRASKSVVFPWSMWPMMETVGALRYCSDPSSAPAESAASSAPSFSSTKNPSSAAVISAAPHDRYTSSDLGSSPRSSRVDRTSSRSAPSRKESLFTVTRDGSLTTLSCWFAE